MGNLFLGFPVPRAKIADMIAEDAPPALHKTQHQDGGTDEIDVTGLTGAGGMANLYADENLFFQTFHDSLDNITSSLTGTAALEFWQGDIYMYTGSTASSVASAMRRSTLAVPVPSWAKDRKFKTKVEIYSDTDNVGTVWIVSGDIGNARHVGFKVVNGVLYGTVANGSAESTVTIETLGAGWYDAIRILEVVFTSGVKAEFFVDGVSKGTITTNLPTGTTTADFLYKLYLTNGAGAKNIELTVGKLKLYQAA